ILVGAEAGNAHGLQLVHRPQDQGIVGGHHGKVDGVVPGKGHDAVQVLGPDAGADGVGGDAAVAGGGVDGVHPGALFQALDDGVLPAAAAYHENVHGKFLLTSVMEQAHAGEGHDHVVTVGCVDDVVVPD